MTVGRATLWAGILPTAFEDFLQRSGTDRDVELLDGVAVERMPVPDEHERLRAWLHELLVGYLAATNQAKQGTFYDGSTPVAINARRGRRPDLFFVSHKRRGIVRNNAAYGAPDVVVEIVSTYDLDSDLAARERDYRAIGVPEIVFLDPIRRQARVVRHRNESYGEETLLPDTALRLGAFPDLAVPMSWLTREPRPAITEAVERLRSYRALDRRQRRTREGRWWRRSGTSR
jgi:Uma2 family endonuclease